MGNEEADEILVITLKQVGCELPEECKNVASFSTEALVRCVSHCLHIIGDTDLPTYSKASLPREMSAKFRACTALADSIKKLGFRDEIGFHQFLYPSEKSTRELFAFLFERLPQSGDMLAGDTGAVGASGILRSITSELSKAKAARSVPFVCRPRTLAGALSKPEAWSYPSVQLSTSQLAASTTGRGASETIPLITEKVKGPHALAPSIFEANALAAERAKEVDLEDASGEQIRARKTAFDKMVKDTLRAATTNKGANQKDSLMNFLEEWAGKGSSISSRFGRAKDFGQDREDDLLALDAELTREERLKLAEEERLARLKREEEEREEEAAEMQKQLDVVSEKAEWLAGEAHQQVQTQRQLDQLLEEQTQKTEELISQYKLKKKTLQLLADRDESMAELKRVGAEAAATLVELAAEWEKYRQPLVDELRKKKSDILKRQEDMKWKIERIKDMRVDMKDMAEEVRKKDELSKSLLEEYNAMPKTAQRGSYTRRIMEIVKNMEKQKKDMRNILKDTREIQKEINTNMEALNRAYGSADDLIYREAKSKGDATSKKMYKLLVTTHECFGELSQTVENTGATLNEIRELELKIEQESVRSGALNMEQVLKDLQDIKTENANLERSLPPQ